MAKDSSEKDTKRTDAAEKETVKKEETPFKEKNKQEEVAKETQDRAEEPQAATSSFSGNKQLYRPEEGRMLGGVSAGLGEYFDLDSTIFRLLFVLLFFAGGSGILLYLILWLIIPSKDQLNREPQEQVKQGAEEIRAKAQDVAQEVRTGNQNNRLIWGLIFILLGLLMTLDNLGIIPRIDLIDFWPLILVALGISLLNR